MKIGIQKRESAYTPEAYAYSKYLAARGCEIEFLENLSSHNDINIYFMGIRPFWKDTKTNAFELHEYHSLSTSPLPLVKNYFKKVVNSAPVGRTFLNRDVMNEFGFSDGVPFLIRDMGVDADLFSSTPKNPSYDVIYCGSTHSRPGLEKCIDDLLKKGFRVLVVGRTSQAFTSLFSEYKNITFSGFVPRAELPNYYKMARAGLNYVPNIYPFSLQTSTKALEYLAAGLTLLTNKNDWVVNFSSKYNVPMVYLDELNSVEDLYVQRDFSLPYAEFEWDSLLERIGFLDFLKGVCEHK